ncbi:MAG: zinc dependent phospholipase C family protein [Desulfovibrionaceae bacterium]|nr:zinc dependent phospholipase C family protein [Desulfovibrionaceae bacterium]
MPKEIVHWEAARLTAERLGASAFGPALSACPEGLLAGAVFHDALFYLACPFQRREARLAKVLHGSEGSDSYEILRLQAGLVRKRPDDPLPAAFLVGLASHIAADAAMHPMIYYLSGNTAHPDRATASRAVAGHRALEAAMDIALLNGLPRPGEHSLGPILARVRARGGIGRACPLDRLAALAGSSEQALGRALRRALANFSFMQSLFLRPAAGRALYASRRALPRPLRNIAALFYAPQLLRFRRALRAGKKYRHPVSGRALRQDLAGLVGEAAANGAALCLEVEEAAFGRKEACLPDPGPCLDTGLPGVGLDMARHFADRPLIEY